MSLLNEPGPPLSSAARRPDHRAARPRDRTRERRSIRCRTCALERRRWRSGSPRRRCRCSPPSAPRTCRPMSFDEAERTGRPSTSKCDAQEGPRRVPRQAPPLPPLSLAAGAGQLLLSCLWRTVTRPLLRSPSCVRETGSRGRAGAARTAGLLRPYRLTGVAELSVTAVASRPVRRQPRPTETAGDAPRGIRRRQRLRRRRACRTSSRPPRPPRRAATASAAEAAAALPQAGTPVDAQATAKASQKAVAARPRSATLAPPTMATAAAADQRGSAPARRRASSASHRGRLMPSATTTIAGAPVPRLAPSPTVLVTDPRRLAPADDLLRPPSSRG